MDPKMINQFLRVMQRKNANDDEDIVSDKCQA